MEFPHGMFEDFNKEDYEIFGRVKDKMSEDFAQDDTAVIVPIGFKEHIDHFIVREAAAAAYKAGSKAKLYFAEDKPYCGITTPQERQRIDAFINKHKLRPYDFEYDADKLVKLINKFYLSQVSPVYEKGIMSRAKSIVNGKLCDRLYCKEK